ncbi:MAG: molecular chaperone TorD family protein [Chloroflexi bacterium]|nr:molecular chaperone TorD family protein [Chloroflexota bacterium]
MRDQIETLIAHDLAYTFLSKAFYEAPEKSFIDLLSAESLFDSWPLDSDLPEVDTGLTLLRNFCSSWDGSNFEALQHDHRRLFIGPGNMLAPPWESVYLSPDHVLFDVQTVEVRRVFQRFGMPIPHLYHEPEDHLGLELRFIAYLCASALASTDKQPEPSPATVNVMVAEVRHFLDAHLLKWAPQCLKLVIDRATTDYYRGCAHLTLGCLAHTSALMQNAAIPLETVR